MKVFPCSRMMALVLLAAAASGCATGGLPAPEAGPRMEPAPATVTSRPVAVVGAAKARADSARYPYTEADVHFMSAMIGHHAQAIDMALLVPSRGGSRSVQVLAERIINAQQDEIGTMQQWLADRGRPVPQAKAGPMRMVMNGMLTDQQMEQLAGATGVAFDRLFLTHMIQHHRGATSMVRTLFGTSGAAQDDTVFKFASDVNVDQSTEIARMERMLATLTP